MQTSVSTSILEEIRFRVGLTPQILFKEIPVNPPRLTNEYVVDEIYIVVWPVPGRYTTEELNEMQRMITAGFPLKTHEPFYNTGFGMRFGRIILQEVVAMATLSFTDQEFQDKIKFREGHNIELKRQLTVLVFPDSEIAGQVSLSPGYNVPQHMPRRIPFGKTEAAVT